MKKTGFTVIPNVLLSLTSVLKELFSFHIGWEAHLNKYFRGNKGKFIPKDMEKSCAILGYYLASWGMMRGSNFLLYKRYKHLEELIKYIAAVDRMIWELQPSEYIKKYKVIDNLYKDIYGKVIKDKNHAIILVTKIMLGVFGIVPECDGHFCECFKKYNPQLSRLHSFNKNSLEAIQNFYNENKIEINKLSNELYTKDFIEAKQNRFNYRKAKIIDRYGFIVGYEALQKTTKTI